MKQFTLFRTMLTVVLLSIWGIASAETYTHTMNTGDITNAGDVTLSGTTWTIATDGGYFGWDGNNAKGIQIGSTKAPAKTLTVKTSGIPGTINSITINSAGASGVNATLTASVGGTTYTPNSVDITSTSADYTFTGTSTGEIVLSYTQTSSKALYIKSISIEYSTDPNFVAAPSASVATGDFYEPISVELTCATAGATIYYTLDSTTPDTTKTAYTAPIAISTTTTLKAVAINGTNVSEVAEYVYTFPTVEEVADIAAFLAKADKTNAVKITGALTVVASNGYKNHYVVDASGALLIYGQLDVTLTAGQTITGIVGKYDNHNGTHELIPSIMGTIAEGTPATPAEMTIAGITATNVNEYVALKNVKAVADGSLTADGKGQFKVYTGTDTIVVYNKFKNIAATVEKDKAYDIEGVVALYNNAPQIYPITVTEATGSTTDVEKVVANTAIYSANGQVIIETDEIGATAEVFTLLGQRVASQTITSQNTAIDAPQGVMIVKVGDKAQKVIVK